MIVFKTQAAIGKSFVLGALVLLYVLSHACPAPAQTLTTGQVLGQVTDPTGAVVLGAKIELRDTATGALRTTVTDSAGQYTFAQVTPGAYSVTVIAKGFAKAVVSAVTAEVGKTSPINGTLKLGQANEVVEVTAPPGAALQTLDATVGNTIVGEEVRALPTLERNTTSLLLLQPLAVPQQFSS